MKSALSEFRGHKKFFFLVLLEIVFAVLIVVSLLKIFNFEIFEIMKIKSYVFALSNSPVDYVFFVLGIVLFAADYLMIRRNPLLLASQKVAWGEIKQTARQKISNAKSDPRSPALLVIEFIFVIVVFVSLFAFFDPDVELIPWSKAGVFPPETTVINAIIAVLVLGMFYWLYSQTALYRQEKKAGGK